MSIKILTVTLEESGAYGSFGEQAQAHAEELVQALKLQLETYCAQKGEAQIIVKSVTIA